MKNLLQHFRKKSSPPQNDAATPGSAEIEDEVHHSLGQDSRESVSHPRFLIILSAFLLTAVCVLGYHFLASQRNDNSLQEMAAPKPLFANNLIANAHHDADAFEKARMLFDNNQIDDSIAVYEKLIKSSPKDVSAINDIGVLYMKKQKFRESEEHLKRSVELDPSCVVCLNNLGYLQTLQGNRKDAELTLKKAIALKSDYLDPYFNLGVLYEKNGDLARSAEAYREYLNHSKDPTSLFNLKLKEHLNSLLEK